MELLTEYIQHQWEENEFLAPYLKDAASFFKRNELRLGMKKEEQKSFFMEVARAGTSQNLRHYQEDLLWRALQQSIEFDNGSTIEMTNSKEEGERLFGTIRSLFWNAP